MSEENRKIVIVVGAGASCDFVVSEDKKLITPAIRALAKASIKKINGNFLVFVQ